MKNNIKSIERNLSKKNLVALLAPSFVAEFKYPEIITMLKKLGFDKVVELTFGAKMVNREYHKKLKNSNKLVISTTCPGIVNLINQKYPQYKKNLVKIDSPMVAMAKICKKIYPKHKTVFISPCNFKKIEADSSKYLDYTIDFQQLKSLFEKNKIKPGFLSRFRKNQFDKFYNDYTKIYPLSGGLSKTSNLKGVLKPGETKIIDGLKEVMDFLDKPDKKIRFLDVTSCTGGCIGGPFITNGTINERKKKVLNYLKKSKCEDIPEHKKGLIENAKGIKFSS